MTPNLLRANWELVRLTESALRHGSEGLDSLPQMVFQLCATGAWREFTLPSGEVVPHERFADFITAKPPRGLGTSQEFLERAISRDQEALSALDNELQQLPGRPEKTVDNIHSFRPSGTSSTAALRRLRKDEPELHAEVLAGRISAHGAMVLAGFRPKTITVPVTRPESVARSLRKYMTADDIARLIAMLISTDSGRDA